MSSIKTKKVKEKKEFFYKRFNKKQKIWFWIGVVVFCIGLGYTNTPEYKAQQAEEQAQQEAEETEEAKANEKTAVEIRNENVAGSLYTIYSACESTISQLLKSPSSAKFQGKILGDWTSGWATNYDNLLYVDSYVDSQNSFGAMIRTKFQVGFKFDEYGTTYEIVWVSLDGTTYLDNRY